jgi:hypothetical protein
MIDVKKLVTGFLVLAVAASASALLISAIGGSGGNFSVQNNSGVAIVAGVGSNGGAGAPANAQQSAALSGNAFLPQDAAMINYGTVTSSTFSSSSTKNLTNDLASALLSNIASTNPSGPQTDANGNQIMAAPNDQAIIAQIASSSALQGFQIPDWDLEAGEQPINVVSVSSSEAASYGNGVVAIFNNYFVQNGLESAFAQNSSPDPSIINTIASSSEQALSDAINLQTPSPAANFQKSFVALLVYQKNFAMLMQNATQDPARTYLIMQAEMPRYDVVVQEFKNAFQTLSGKNLSLNTTGGQSGNQTLSLFADMFGIKTAHAQWAVFDVTNFAEEVLIYAQEYLSYVLEWTQWLNSILLQVLKNGFVVALQGQVTNWVQGGGKPRYVQNWSKTFSTAFNSAANGVISQTIPNLSPSFSVAAQTLLQQNNSGNPPIRSNIDQEYATLGTTQQDFYNNFSDGGMSAYLDLFQPDNNLFGAVMDTQDEALAAGSNQYAATQAQDIAANGFTGDTGACDDGSDPNGVTYSCYNNNDSFYSQTPSCPVGYQLQTISNNGSCSDGSEPTTLTPGEVTAQTVSDALQSGQDLVVNANNTIDLLFAVANSLLKLISSGSKLVNAHPPASYQPSGSAQSIINTYSQPPQQSGQPTPPANPVGPTSSFPPPP